MPDLTVEPFTIPGEHQATYRRDASGQWWVKYLVNPRIKEEKIWEHWVKQYLECGASERYGRGTRAQRDALKVILENMTWGGK